MKKLSYILCFLSIFVITMELIQRYYFNYHHTILSYHFLFQCQSYKLFLYYLVVSTIIFSILLILWKTKHIWFKFIEYILFLICSVAIFDMFTKNMLYSILLITITLIYRIFFNKRTFIFCCIIFSILFVSCCCEKYSLVEYIKMVYYPEVSNFYEENYIPPKTAKITPPETKKNLVILILESMEFTYANLDRDWIPELTKLSQENISFSNYENGYTMNFTMGHLIAMFCGIPCNFLANQICEYRVINQAGERRESIAPHAYSLGQILQDYGYTTFAVQSGSKQFSGTNTFLESHGVKDTSGLNELINHPARVHSVKKWGLNDIDTYEIFKDKIKNAPTPFCGILTTISTHMQVQEIEKEVLINIKIASQLAKNFIDWLQENYPDTTIVIVGDHTRMGKYFQNIPNRRIYNTFINSCITPPNTNRTFWAMDLLPSILESIGFQIENHRLGLGVSIFSSQKTLIESLGNKKLTQELKKKNHLYNFLW